MPTTEELNSGILDQLNKSFDSTTELPQSGGAIMTEQFLTKTQADILSKLQSMGNTYLNCVALDNYPSINIFTTLSCDDFETFRKWIIN